ncbi:hypothetical protein [Desulfopila sp. IMCC35008]|uniref:hypothetical protein n=1 Tax=Desulfopila sp. IMCC35008 TaxID=2653858 RepID=UPI0013D66D52|nr:hypothetical protein [Desulfopila sp. IMCC35008]
MADISKKLYWLSLLFIVFYSPSAHGSAPTIPEQLQPWVPWVLHGQEERLCTSSRNGKDRFCVWPEPLELKLQSTGGTFKQKWRMKKEGWILLPGQEKYWPQKVKMNNKAALLVNKQGMPAIYIDKPGNYTVRGSFTWQSLPESIRIPSGTALISPFTLNGDEHSADITGNTLWLSRQSDNKDQQQDTIHTQVYRLIRDTIPMMVTSRIELQVSGKPREIQIDWQLPENQIPIRLHSNLPVKIGTDGLMHMQARPGNFTILYESRLRREVETLRFDKSELGPDTEYWSFEAHNQLRMVKIKGDATAVDPSRTTIPGEWHTFPAYLMKKGQSMVFETIKRGNPEPPPNQLTLHRTLWLDSDGSGITIQDAISGTVHRQPRLEMQEPAELGRMVINGQDQLITRLSVGEPAGVEVRQGQINGMAVSRLEGTMLLPAGGWGQSIQNLSAQLILPPGWKLLHATGVDTARTWLSRWTLLDCFIVLIIVISTFKLLGFIPGTLALIGLTLSYHDPEAPVYLWLALLGCIGIIKAVPDSRFIILFKRARVALLIGLVIIVLPYSVEQLRIGFFPQLERVYQPYSPPVDQQSEMSYTTVMEDDAIPEAVGQYAGKVLSKRSVPADIENLAPKRLEQQYDTQSKVQAGPGVPDKKWRVIPLTWNGPVEKELMLELIMISPIINLVLTVLKVMAIFLLAFFMFDREKKTSTPVQPTSKARVTTAAAVFLLLLTTASVPFGYCSQYPDSELLQTLRTRMLEPDKCFPDCADLESMQIVLKGSKITLTIQANSIIESAVRLPQGEGIFWRGITLDKVRIPVLENNNNLWVPLNAGRHTLRMTGLLNATDLQLMLPVTPHTATFDGSNEWSVEGLDINNVPGGQLQFIKSDNLQNSEDFETSTLPPLMQVERILHLGLQWRVETVITRLSPVGTSVFLTVPLLEGESVTNPEYEVDDYGVKVGFATNQKQKRWSSVFEKKSRILLEAPETTEWYEIWRLDASPIWHVEADGFAPIHHHSKGGAWRPEWRPWPGEKLSLDITRPKGVPGTTKTIDSSLLQISPGLRSTAMQLALTIRSTRGDQQQVIIPENATIQSVKINGREQPVKNERTVIVPLTPGSQHIEITWQTPEGISTVFEVPEIDLGSESVNGTIEIRIGKRWVWFVKGPRIGPAILFYSELLIILIASIILGYLKITPLRSYHWFILGFGLCQSGLIPCLVIVGWFVALKIRAEKGNLLNGAWFNLAQVVLVALTLITIGALIFAIRNGLLGHPDMLIAGNNSSSFLLRWYQDRVVETALPQPMVVSIPMLAYRITMLTWALWLAFNLLKWVKWGWHCFTVESGWKQTTIGLKRKKKSEPAQQTSTITKDDRPE